MKREPAWGERPVAVVEQDRPQAKIFWVNEHARKGGVLAGMRYAAGLSLEPELCAGVVSVKELGGCIDALAEVLRGFTPHVEPCQSDPGVFWVDASGLGLLHPTLRAWALRVHEGLLAAGFLARIVVGSDRFKTYAIAQSRQGPRTQVLSEEHEAERAGHVRLDRLEIEPKVRDDLQALGVETIQDLLKLPPAALRSRYGKKIHHMHALARGDNEPLQPQQPVIRFRQHTNLDDPEKDSNRLLFLVKRMLDPLLEQLVDEKKALARLTIEFKLDRGGARTETLRPADPTIDVRQVLNLAMLRLDALRLKEGVIELTLVAEPVAASYEQLSLFKQRQKRDLKSAGRAFARLRAEFGDHAVVYAELSDGHLPEACFRWAPLWDPRPPQPPRLMQRMLVRRILERPLPLPHRPRQGDDGWQLRGRDDPPVAEVKGPYVVSGGWWKHEVCREYHFIRNLNDEWSWVFYDRHRRRWYLQGRIE